MTTSFLTINYNGPPDKSFSKVLQKAYELSDLGIVFEYWNLEYGAFKKRWHLHAKVRSPYRFQYAQFNVDDFQVYAKSYGDYHLKYMMEDTYLNLCTNINHRHDDVMDCRVIHAGYMYCQPPESCDSFDLHVLSTNNDLLVMKGARDLQKDDIVVTRESLHTPTNGKIYTNSDYDDWAGP